MKSGYDIGDEYIVDGVEDLKHKLKNPPVFKTKWLEWLEQAKLEKQNCLDKIAKTIKL